MSLTIKEALRQVSLSPGQTYECRVRGLQVEVRVSSITGDLAPELFVESEVMLDPWVDLPNPESTTNLQAIPGNPPTPDIPHIPADGQPHDL